MTPALGDGAGEVGVLGIEAVAGVHAVDPGPLDDVEDRVGVEVALGGGLATEGVRLVRIADVQRVAVELGVHRDRGDPELSAGTHHAHGDLAAVRDQDLLEQRSPPNRPFTERRILRAVPRPQAIPPEGPSAFTRPVVRRARFHQPLPRRRGPGRGTGRDRRGGRPPDRRARPPRPDLGGAAGRVAPHLGAAAPAAPGGASATCSSPPPGSRWLRRWSPRPGWWPGSSGRTTCSWATASSAACSPKPPPTRSLWASA